MRHFLLGFDPAQIRDFAALCAIEVTAGRNDLIFKLVALERRQRLSYPDLVLWVKSALGHPEFHKNTELVLDATGVGIAVRDLLIKAGIRPIAVTTTPGNSVTKVDKYNYHVGKAALIGKFLSAFDAGRFQMNPNLPIYPQFERELLAFKSEITARGNAIFEAGENEHDDLISACALVTWWAEPRPKQAVPLTIPRGEPIIPAYRISQHAIRY